MVTVRGGSRTPHLHCKQNLKRHETKSYVPSQSNGGSGGDERGNGGNDHTKNEIRRHMCTHEHEPCGRGLWTQIVDDVCAEAIADSKRPRPPGIM